MRTINETLHKIDCKDGTTGDLGSLYESVEQKLTASDKNELKQLLAKTDDPKEISGFISAKTTLKESADPDSEISEDFYYEKDIDGHTCAFTALWLDSTSGDPEEYAIQCDDIRNDYDDTPITIGFVNAGDPVSDAIELVNNCEEMIHDYVDGGGAHYTWKTEDDDITEKTSTSKVKSALFGDKRGVIKTFAVLTAENPGALKQDDITNRQSNNKLKKDIEGIRYGNSSKEMIKAAKKMNLQYIPILGRYGGEDEHSFIIINISLDDAKYLSEKYGQKAFFFGKCNSEKDENGEFVPKNATVYYYEYDNDGKEFKLVDQSEEIQTMDSADDFFSKHGNLLWSFIMDCFNEDLRPVSNMASLDESLNDNLTSRGRFISRCRAYRESKNNTQLDKLTEANLNKIVNGHDKDGYAIISACRQDAVENPNSAQQTTDENNKRTDNLKKDIHSLHFSYVPVFGGYKEDGQDKFSTEKSFIVFPYDRNSGNVVGFEDFQKSVIDLGKKYNQDSVLIKQPDGDAKYYICSEDRFDDSFVPKSATMNDVQQNYFTALKGWKDISLNKKGRDNWVGKPQRFTYTESYISKQPQSVMEATRRGMSGELFIFNR